jgi:hypothetical protein
VRDFLLGKDEALQEAIRGYRAAEENASSIDTKLKAQSE